MTTRPQYSAVIPAYNEQSFLPQTLSALSSAMEKIPMRGEVIVVDNNSDDRTPAIALEYGARVVHEPINQISRARNKGAQSAVGRYLIFIDADTLVSAAVLQQALQALLSETVCGGGARIAIDHNSRFANRIVAWWNSFAKRTGLAAGCFIFMRREAFDDIGGFSQDVYASEEIWLSLALKRWGRKRQQEFRILDESVLTSARKVDWLSTGDMIKQIFVFLLFPLAVRSKRWCGAWYRRPDSRESTMNR